MNKMSMNKFPGNTFKAVTLSFDDGVMQDKRLVDMLNKYGLKCTFNINTGSQSHANSRVSDGVVITRMNVEEMRHLYDGHEVAVHALTHPHLENMDEETIYNEIHEDALNIERIFGYAPVGMAYPYGTYDERVIRIAEQCGMRYARAVKPNYDFTPQENLLTFAPTCHYADEKLFSLFERFMNEQVDSKRIFYVWGHSYELDTRQNWDVMEKFCETVAAQGDKVFNGTNREVLL